MDKCNLRRVLEVASNDEICIKWYKEQNLIPVSRKCSEGHDMQVVIPSPGKIGYFRCQKKHMSDNKIGGDSKVVEIDESKFGKRKYNVGGIVEGQWILGMIDQETRELCLEVCPGNSRRGVVLLPLIQKHVAKGTIIMTDEWAGYNNLESSGYIHLTVNHSRNFVNPGTGAHTQNIESQWKALKQVLLKSSLKKEYIDNYLSEYLFRRHVAQMKGLDIFDAFLHIIRSMHDV